MPRPPRNTKPRDGTAAGNDEMPERSVSSSSSSCGIGNDPGDRHMMLVSATPSKKTKHRAPQDAIDEFWAKFDSKTPGKATTILPKNTYAEKAGEKVPKGEVKGECAVSSYEEAAKMCKDKVAKIVKECRRINQKYVDQHFNIEFDLKWGRKDCLTTLSNPSEVAGVYSSFLPGSAKRVGDIFDSPQFFADGATANDIRQGRDGDCWFLAALCTLGNKPGLIERVCVARDEQVGVYGFVFHRDGEWISEVIDDKLYLIKPDFDESWEERALIEDHQRIDSQEDYRKIYQSNSQALYFAQCEDANETWLPLLEKAYAKAHGDFAAIEGGFTGEGLEDLTGGVTTEVFTTDILDKEYFWKEELMKVNEEFLFGCWSGMFWGRGYRKGVYEGHAYSIMKCVEMDGERLCLIRNPWGKGEWNGPWSDGSKEWTPEWMTKLEHRFGDDGQFWMSYEDLLRTYQTFDRTRLFTEEWKVTQKWTSLTVPWSVEYNDTKFSFTLENDTSVVIVLSQLDSRYFVGLEGRYSFELGFRVHKAGEEDYIVRSNGNYAMRRSVDAELDLEAGEYHVLVRVEATRNSEAAQVEDVLRNNVKERRDKVLRMGLSYDMAHAKGQIFQTEEGREGKKKAEAARKAKEKKEMRETLIKERKKRKHNQNREKRKGRAANAKRKIKKQAKEEKKAKKLKVEEKEPVTGEALKAQEKVKKFEVVKLEIVDEAKAAGAEKALEQDLECAEKTESVEIPAEDSTEENSVKIPSIAPEVPEAPTIPKPDEVGSEANYQTESDDESITSEISTISSIEVEDAILKDRLAADAFAPPPRADEEDEFEKDPWNAVAVVGLRVYSKGSGVSVNIVRPRDWEDGEGKLDVDDSARDATRGVDGGKEGD